MHEASSGGYLDMVQFLVEEGVDIDPRNDLNETPLFQASSNGHSDISKYLIDRGADTNIQRQDHVSLLHIEARNGHLDVVKSILIMNANSVNVKGGQNDETPLHFANNSQGRDNIEVVKLLIENGADVRAKDKFNFTPLHRAAFTGKYEIVDYLLKNHPELKAELLECLILACRMRQSEVVEVLLKHEAPVNASDSKHATPLRTTVLSGDVDLRSTLQFLSSVVSTVQFQ